MATQDEISYLRDRLIAIGYQVLEVVAEIDKWQPQATRSVDTPNSISCSCGTPFLGAVCVECGAVYSEQIPM